MLQLIFFSLGLYAMYSVTSNFLVLGVFNRNVVRMALNVFPLDPELQKEQIVEVEKFLSSAFNSLIKRSVP